MAKERENLQMEITTKVSGCLESYKDRVNIRLKMSNMKVTLEIIKRTVKVLKYLSKKNMNMKVNLKMVCLMVWESKYFQMVISILDNLKMVIEMELES